MPFCGQVGPWNTPCLVLQCWGSEQTLSLQNLSPRTESLTPPYACSLTEAGPAGELCLYTSSAPCYGSHRQSQLGNCACTHHLHHAMVHTGRASWGTLPVHIICTMLWFTQAEPAGELCLYTSSAPCYGSHRQSQLWNSACTHHLHYAMVHTGRASWGTLPVHIICTMLWFTQSPQGQKQGSAWVCQMMSSFDMCQFKKEQYFLFLSTKTRKVDRLFCEQRGSEETSPDWRPQTSSHPADHIKTGLQCSNAQTLNIDRPEHHSTDRLNERGVEKERGWHSILRGRE